MMNWMQLASPRRSPEGFVTRPDVRARPHTTPTYIRDVCSYAISWVRGYLTIRPVFAPGNDSRPPHTRAHTRMPHANFGQVSRRILKLNYELRARVYEAFTAVSLGGGGGGGGDFRRAVCETLRLAVISSMASSRQCGEKRRQRGKEASK